jgi:hypothetical protein
MRDHRCSETNRLPGGQFDDRKIQLLKGFQQVLDNKEVEPVADAHVSSHTVAPANERPGENEPHDGQEQEKIHIFAEAGVVGLENLPQGFEYQAVSGNSLRQIQLRGLTRSKRTYSSATGCCSVQFMRDLTE